MAWEVWSSGLEEWEPCEVPTAELEFLYVKTVRGKPYTICRDKLNRYFRYEVPDDSDG